MTFEEKEEYSWSGKESEEDVLPTSTVNLFRLRTQMPTHRLHFPPFALDEANACLWRGHKQISLPPTDFAVLHYLVTHPDQVVTHEELLRAVWPGTVVAKGVLKVRLHHLRRVLGDKVTKPRFIETVQRQGYRWIAPLTTTQPRQNVKGKVQNGEGISSPYPLSLSPLLVGREAELARLHALLEKAMQGQRQLVFVTGEPGIGKTALLDAFLAQSGTSGQVPNPQLVTGNRPLATVFIGRGQCIEQYGAGEPYLPVLEALERLCRGSQSQQLTTVLRQYAPTWLIQLSGVLSVDDLKTLQPRVQGTTRERMLRELAHALEVLTTDQPLVLVLEDLHWSDASTVEFLSLLARRPEPARLLIIGTYRPTEVLDSTHPLKALRQELLAHQLCTELLLSTLQEVDIETYLQHRFPHSVLPTALAQTLWQRTGGNPLFLVSVVTDFVVQRLLSYGEGGWSVLGPLDTLVQRVPDTIRHLVDRQRERLTEDEQRLLQAASVAGLHFSVAAVAAALATDLETVSTQCGRLAERQQFLRPAGITEWPDGTWPPAIPSITRSISNCGMSG